MAQAARNFIMRSAGQPLAAFENMSVTVAAEGIDVTDSSSDAFRTFMEDVLASQTMSLSMDGVTKGGTLRTAGMSPTPAGKHLSLEVEFPNKDKIAGVFLLTSYAENGAHNEAVKFSASFESAGPWTFTAA